MHDVLAVLLTREHNVHVATQM